MLVLIYDGLKYEEKSIIRAAKEKSIDLKVIDSEEKVIPSINSGNFLEDIDCAVLRTRSKSRTLEIAFTLKETGVPSVNQYDEISLFINKWKTFLVLGRKETYSFYPLPTFLSLYAARLNKHGQKLCYKPKYIKAKEKLEREIGYPMILKPLIGSHGEGIGLINNGEELYEKMALNSSISIIQKHVPSFFDLRLVGVKKPGKEPEYIAGIARLSKALIKNTHARVNPGVPIPLKENNRLKRVVKETLNVFLPRNHFGIFGLDYILPTEKSEYEQRFEKIYHGLREKFKYLLKERKKTSYRKINHWSQFKHAVRPYINDDLWVKAVEIVDEVISDVSIPIYFLESNVVQEYPNVEQLNEVDIGSCYIDLAVEVSEGRGLRLNK